VSRTRAQLGHAAAVVFSTDCEQRLKCCLTRTREWILYGETLAAEAEKQACDILALVRELRIAREMVA
jgi:hypothetical protein